MDRTFRAALHAAERLLRRTHTGAALSRTLSLHSPLKITTATQPLSSQTPLSPLFSRFKPLSTAREPPKLGLGLELKDEAKEEEASDGWEEEEEGEPKLGDGGDGGGVLLGEVAWGERALAAAQEVLLQFGEDFVIFGFKVSPKGYVYVRLDKLTNEYGCPSMEELENFSDLYKKQLDEIGQSGEIPDDLALEVSSPGAERLLKIPGDLDRFKDMPMWVHYIEEDQNSKHQRMERVLMLESVDAEARYCVWRLANVKENRETVGKGRPLSRKQKDWRLTLAFEAIEKVSLYLDSKA